MPRAWGLLVALVMIGMFPTAARAAGTADVSLSVTGPSIADQGTEVRYTVGYANAGPETAANLTVAVFVPSGLFIDLISSSGFCTVAVGGQNVSCDVGSVAAGGSGSLAIVISADVAGTYSLPFRVSSDQADGVPSNNDVAQVLEVQPPTHADLFVEFINVTSARATEPALVQTVYSNGGPLDATGVVISFHLASGLHYQPAASDSRCAASGQAVTCAIGTVGMGEQALLFITVTADVAGSYPFTASIQGDQPDQNSDNSVASFNLQITPAEADLGIQVVGTTIRAVVGSPVHVAYQAFNSGPDTATSVVFEVAFPAGWAADAAHSDPRCASPSPATLRCPTAPWLPESGPRSTSRASRRPQAPSPWSRRSTATSCWPASRRRPR